MILEGVLQRIILEILKDPIGSVIQIATIICSLVISYLFSKKGTERYGYLLSFLTLPVFATLEYWYEEWVYFILNPIYLGIFWIGLRNHWRKNEKSAN